MSAASDNLRYHQCQLDEDGVMVGVSRQAVEETLLELVELRDLLRDARSNHVAGSREDEAWDKRRASVLTRED